MSDITCTNCSTVNRSGATFCRNCGAKLPAEIPPTVFTPPESPPAVDKTRYPVDQPALRPVQPPVAGPVRSGATPARPSASSPWLSVTANLAALVFGLVFVVFIAFALPVLNVAPDLLDGERYKASLREQAVYSRFPDLFAEQMLRSQDSLANEARLDLSGVTTADWKLVATQLVTPQWMQTQVESLIDQVFAAAKPGAAPPTLKVSLAEVADRLGGDAGFNIYKQIIATKPSCSLDDFFDIIDWISETPGIKLKICNIPPFLTDIAALIGGYENGDDLIRDLLKQLPESIPTEVALSDLFTVRMDRIGGWVSSMTTLAWISLVLGLGALLATLFSPFVRTLRGFLLVWGACLALAGMVCLVESQVMPYTLGGLIVGLFSSSLAPSISKIILETGRSVTESGANSLFWPALAMFLIGLAMAAGGALVWAVRKYRK